MSTLAAISTAPGTGGIGIIRMSGEDSFKILNKFFIPKNKKNEKIKGYTIKYGTIINNEKQVVDEVLVSFFKSPKSYTSENMCEINSHGGLVIMNQILEICLKNGAQLAEPGEFTKRAFLNGRIDLTQAEAVIDIINAKTDKEAKVSIEQLEGNLSKKITEIRTDILDILSDIEANIDYPEYDIEETSTKKVSEFLDKIYSKLNKLEKSFDNGKILREGVLAAIIGRPNAGKSSLLNLILNEERAIVTDIEGTTRDTIEEFISVDGIPLKIIDTAGIRNTDDAVEKIGVEKAIEIAKKSDVVIAIFDINRKLNEEDEKIINLLKEKNAIIILNKIDLENRINIEKIEKLNKPIIKMSAKNGQGLEELYSEISKLFKLKEIASSGEIIVSNNRHKYLIKKAIKNVEICMESVENNIPVDMISGYIKQVFEDLGEITGDTATEDILNTIFSKFCLGK